MGHQPHRQTNLRLTDATREMLILMADRQRVTNAEMADQLIRLGAAAMAAGYVAGELIPPKRDPEPAAPARRAAKGIGGAGMFSNPT